MKKLLMSFLVASLMITSALSLNSCKKAESNKEIPGEDVIIKDRTSFRCPICGYIMHSNEAPHIHLYEQPDICPLGEYNEETGEGCTWFHKEIHIHRYYIIGNGNIIQENEHLGGGTGEP